MATFEGYIVFETTKAIMFEGHYWHQPAFLPKSQIFVYRGLGTEEVVLEVKDWLVCKNDWDEFKEWEGEDDDRN